MKVRSIRIKNYRSLRDVSLDDVGDLTVFIGPNSSGKSNLLEALDLFFKEFDLTKVKTTSGLDDYLWYDRDTDNPIEFALTFELNETECNEIFPDTILKFAKDLTEQKYKRLSVCREIVDTSGKWETVYVRWADLLLVENDELLPKALDKLVSSKISKPSNPKKAEEEEEEEEEVILEEIVSKISKTIEKEFKLIPSVRDALPSGTTTRTSFLGSEIQKFLRDLGLSDHREDQRGWRKMRKNFQSSSYSSLGVHPKYLYVEEEDIRFPIQYIGGGDQENLILLVYLSQNYSIFGIEEPETHLHPKLSRSNFKILQSVSKKKQIILATHSPIFVDQTYNSNTWIVRKQNRETIFSRIKDEKGFRDMLYELGAKPSDALFPDAILFVEGWTEKVVLPILAEKIGYDLTKPGLSIIQTRGKDTGKYHLQMWTEIAKNVGVPFFMLLDKDAKESVEEIIRQKLIKRRYVFTFPKGDIEDYYPPSKIVKVLKSEYDIDIASTEIRSPKKKTIEAILKTNNRLHDGWKVAIGRKVAKLMSPSEMHDDIRKAIETIILRLKLA